MYFQTKDGQKIYYQKRSGKGRPIVLLHGLACSGESWIEQSKIIKRPQIIIDFLGHGKSSKPKGKEYYNIERTIEDIKELIKSLNIKDYDVIGFSMGAYVASHLSAKKKILINPLINKESIKKSFILKAWVAKQLPLWIYPPFKRGKTLSDYHGLLSDYAKMLLKTPSHVYWPIIEQISELKECDVSDSVIITSDRDEIIKHSRWDHQVKGHHHVMVENPIAINKLIRELIK